MSGTIERARILIVDDQEANVKVLDRILRKSGATDLHFAGNAAEAIGAFMTCRPDIVLLDLHLPDRSGLDVLERINQMVAGDDFVPVLMMTGDSAPEVKQQALAMGARDFVAKPFEFTEVLLRIRNLLETRWLHLRLREENATLDVRVRERTRELEETRTEMLERLGRAGEFRDDCTGQHARRVGELAGVLASAIGLSRAEAEIIRRAAPLHDIGKIGVPDSILLKPDRLTAEEFRVMMTHATLGSQILSGSQSDVLRCAEEIARSHHERWDGSGYPVGLKGDDIPLAARIVAVVDFYDALSSDRPYRKAWPREKIAAEIQRQRGVQFDPQIADKFLDLVAGFADRKAA
jgi:putative two-component system response regulator